MPLEPGRTVDELHELRELTGNEDGAQRVAWTDTWVAAKEWLSEKVAPTGAKEEIDEAGNQWFTLAGGSEQALLIGGHIDSVPNGGWLDGALNVIVGVEVLRRIGADGTPPVTVRLVNWADEEGARFGRSLFGSSAVSGTMDDQDEIRERTDADGVRWEDALAAHGVDLDQALEARRQLENAGAYLELHIEQGPVLEAMDLPLGVVLGTFGVERHQISFRGQAAHAGSTPLPLRRDAFLAAAQTAVECREAAHRIGGPAVCTTGFVSVQPNVPTAIAGRCEMSLDVRALDPSALGALMREARAAADRCAAGHQVSVEWRQLWQIEPRAFDPALVGLCEEAVREETGQAPRLPSGPVHDATEMAALMPAVMLFAASPNGLSHCREEDTPDDVLEQAIRAYVRLVGKTIEQLKSEV